MRRRLIETVSDKVADDLPKREHVRSLAVLPLTGDGTGFVTIRLRERISASGKYQILEESFLRKLLREVRKETIATSQLNDAVTIARKLGVDAVIFGEMREFTVSDDAATLKLELRMAERESGQAVFARSYTERVGGTRMTSTYWRARLADSPAGARIITWVMFTLLLPLVTAPLVRRLAAEESNTVNLLMLLGYTLVDMLAAAFLTGFWIPSPWTAGLLLLALSGSGYYNYWIASFIDRMRA